jgi:hypothetical protein
MSGSLEKLSKNLLDIYKIYKILFKFYIVEKKLNCLKVYEINV